MKTHTKNMDVALFATSILHVYFVQTQRKERPHKDLQEGERLDADELICVVTPENIVLTTGERRAKMRLENLWHRATYVAIRHEPEHLEQHGDHPSDVYVLVQKRSSLKDYYPGRFDATPGGVVGFGETSLENASREMQEEMGIDVTAGKNDLTRLFTFSFEDEHVRVWGEFYECIYRGALKDLRIQREEVDSVERMSLQELRERMDAHPEQFMPDSCHAMRLFLQRRLDLSVNRRLLKGYSSSDLDSYDLRPRPAAIFFDCDDCLYFDGWKTANLLTEKIENWCVGRGLKAGQAYEMYKEYGTALRYVIIDIDFDDCFL